ncbi:MAG TPA: glycosyltransferase, partial [Chondromyces sp.]|nr:glycosyltransferase [Chondromyces sp.]
ARAGATTLAELTALGVPSILIPSPYVTNNHQEKNARSLTDEGAAVLLLEKDLNSESLLKELDGILMNKNMIEEMKVASRKLGIPDASERLYKLMLELADK